MAPEPTSSGFASGNSQPFGDKLSSAATSAKTHAADLGRKAADGVDRARGAAADGLSSAAGTVENGADVGLGRAKRAVHATANALSSSADYLRENSARDMMDDAMDVVKNNPGVALIGAVALGFIVGRAFSARG